MIRALRALIVERDRLFSALALPTYGAWSLLEPSGSMAQLAPPAETGAYVLFVVAGPLILAGSLGRSLAAFVLGHILAITGLLTVAGVIVTTSESSVAALAFGYAAALSYNLQRALRERKIIAAIEEDTQPLALPTRGRGDQ